MEAEVGRFVHSSMGLRLCDRARAFAHIRSFFCARRFTEVDTPLAVPSPGLDLHLDAVMAGEQWLITSPEYQMKRLLVGGLPRIFPITHVFAKARTGRAAQPRVHDARILSRVRGRRRDDRGHRRARGEPVRAFRSSAHGDRGRAFHSLAPPFDRLPVADAFERYAGIAEPDALRSPRRTRTIFFGCWSTRSNLRSLALHARYSLPTTLHHRHRWPEQIRAIPGFARGSSSTSAGVELCNGFGELTCPPSSGVVCCETSVSARKSVNRSIRWTSASSPRSTKACRRRRAMHSVSTDYRALPRRDRHRPDHAVSFELV